MASGVESRAWSELDLRMREICDLDHVGRLLSWDQETYMPAGGVEHRGRQLALLLGLLHERAGDPRVGELLAAVEGAPSLADGDCPDGDCAAAANVRELRREYDRATRVPRELVEELARTTAAAHEAWVAARKHARFATFRPWLEKIVALKRSEAEALGYAATPYDALLDTYEPGAEAASVARLFDALRRELIPLVAAILDSPRRPRTAVLHRDYPVERQRVFGEAVAAAVGFDFERGRVDTSVHPFCVGVGPGDCRLTARWSANDFAEGVLGVLHEVGHALYEQGLDPAHAGTPMGEAVSLGVHESQSRLWENRVGRSRDFWAYFLPRARELFHDALRDVALDEFVFAINDVRPSAIRVRADEVTYNLHTLIRFELERALIAGDLAAADVPDAWNALYREHLGVTPADDAEGCLQDSHWSAGLIGYFPTYTIGDICAAQLFARATADLGDLPAAFREGHFEPLREWLRERVHRHGHRWRTAALVERVTGAPPDPRALVDALRQKYGELYGL